MTVSPSPKYPNRVRELRKACGLSSKEVATRANIPLPTYFGLERGRLPLTLERAAALAPIFDASPPDLQDAPLAPAVAVRSRNDGDADLERLLQICLTYPKKRRRLAADLLTALKRAWE